MVCLTKKLEGKQEKNKDSNSIWLNKKPAYGCRIATKILVAEANRCSLRP